MAGNKDQIVLRNPGAGPVQVVIEVRRLVVFVNAKERDVEVIPRIGEVVGIAAEKRGFEFGSKDQAYIGILFVFV